MVNEYDQLQASNMERLQRLKAQGTIVNGLREGYQTRLLEELVGDALPFVKLKHEQWVSEQLDEIEAGITRARLLAPRSPQGNG